MRILLPTLIIFSLLNTSCRFFSNAFSGKSNTNSISKDIITIDINNSTIATCQTEIPPLDINIKSTAFSRDKAMFLAAFMDTVYKTTNDEYKKIITSWGFYNISHTKDDFTGAEFVLAANDDVILVGLVGSNEKIDWTKNFTMDPVSSIYFTGLTHKGFLDGFKEILPTLNNELNKLINISNRPIMFAGHSLGGAHALLLAEYFSTKTADNGKPLNINAVYTFGQPRVGDMVFATQVTNTLQERYVRIYNGYDPIVHSPNRTATSREQMRLIAPILFNNVNVDLNLQAIEYTHPEGLLIKLREYEKGAVLTTIADDEKSDATYWINAVAIANKSTVEAGLYLTDHKSGAYMCSTLRLYNNIKRLKP